MTTWEIVLLTLAAVCSFAYLIGSTIWVSQDAPKRGITNGIPAALTFLMGPFGLILWLAMRPPIQNNDK